MKIGERLALGSTLNDDNMVFLKQLGVDLLSAALETGREPKGDYPFSQFKAGAYYNDEDLIALKKWVEGHGLELSGINLAMFPRWEKILLGLPGRDEQIENWNKSLVNLGKAGIPMVQYNPMINAGSPMPLWRTSADKIGRGGTLIFKFDYDTAKKVPPTAYGEVTEKAMWDNLIYFLKAVIPVAEKAGVTMSLHPYDPPVPSLAGIARIIHNVAAYDRLFKTVPDKANCMTFCLSTFGQMLDNEAVYSAIKHFAKENRIGCVHFSGVKGTLAQSEESFPDESRLDNLRAVRTLKESGFNGLIEVDHAPHPIGDTDYGHMSHAFQIGYLKGIMQGAGVLN
jgi:mannonate dehydratase